MQEDIGTAFEISEITFVIDHSSGASYVNEFTLSLAHVESDQLTNTFTANYQTASLVEVYYTDSLDLSGENGDEICLELQTPFQYNGQDNLLLDINYPDGSCWTAAYMWEAGSARCLTGMFLPGGSAGSTGDLFDSVPYMILEGTESLDQCTFGAIKIELGGMGTDQ